MSGEGYAVNLKQIEAFVKIADNSSFSRTAEELYLTQPTVSAYIAGLEDELGVRLFARTTKTVALTEDGKKLYTYARQMVELSDRIRSVFQECGAEAPAKEIVISASTIPAQYLLPHILAEYSRSCPQARFRVVESDSEGVIRDIAEHRADIGFAGTRISHPSCEFTPFYEDELILVAPNKEKYRGRMARGGDLDWIREEPFVLRENGSGTRREAMKRLHEVGIAEDNLNIVANFGNTDAVLMSVKEGVGLSVTSRLAARDRIERGELLGFRLSEGGCFRELYMVTSRSLPMSEAVKKLIHLVGKSFAGAGADAAIPEDMPP